MAVETVIAPIHKMWIAEIRELANAAESGEALSHALLEWSGKATTPYAEALGEALVLAGLIGRSQVLDETDDATFTDASAGSLDFKEMQDFLKQKVSMPSKTWAENLHQAHDRAFVIAGADNVALVEDLRTALMKSIAAGGGGIEAFRADFDAIVERTGWSYNGGRNWRTRVIYETNIRTAHQAGRLAQMRDPDVVKSRPYWQYVHAQAREPKAPREEHVAWDGKVFMHDDPIWKIIFPPNGWKCSCGVRTLSAAGMRRLGKAGPDKAPKLKMRKVKDPATGVMVDVPEGIDFGWAYQPGDTWEQGLVPHELQLPLESRKTGTRPSGLDALRSLVRPRAAKVADIADAMPPADAEAVVSKFLAEFDASIGLARLYRDKVGQVIVISDGLFRSAAGAFKALKRGREREIGLLAETIKDPDEIWLNWEEQRDGGWRLVRVYLRSDPKSLAMTKFKWAAKFWSGVTSFAPDDESYLEKERKGVLLYRRK